MSLICKRRQIIIVEVFQMNFEFLNIDNMSFLKRVETINSGTGEL